MPCLIKILNCINQLKIADDANDVFNEIFKLLSTTNVMKLLMMALTN